MLATLPRPATGPIPFKQGMRALLGAVTVIAAQDRSGASLGLTATAVTSLSADPPTLLVSVNRSSALALALNEPGASFSVNVLGERQAEVAQAFGGQRGLRGAGKFAFGDWYRSEHDVPLLAGARVGFECVVAERAEWATHLVVAGRVTEVHFGQGAGGALAYLDGRYVTVG